MPGVGAQIPLGAIIQPVAVMTADSEELTATHRAGHSRSTRCMLSSDLATEPRDGHCQLHPASHRRGAGLSRWQSQGSNPGCWNPECTQPLAPLSKVVAPRAQARREKLQGQHGQAASQRTSQRAPGRCGPAVSALVVTPPRWTLARGGQAGRRPCRPCHAPSSLSAHGFMVSRPAGLRSCRPLRLRSTAPH